MLALLTTPKIDRVAIFALLSSITTAAWMSATMSIDFDLEETRRKQNPQFYGFIPNGTRGKAVFIAIVFFDSLCNLVVRALACVLLSFKGSQFVAAVLGGEALLILGRKAFNGNLLYWIPFYGVISYLNTFFSRTIAKVISDWTFLARLRHPQEVGGASFLQGLSAQ